MGETDGIPDDIQLLDPYQSHALPTTLPDAIQDLLAVDLFIDSCGDAKHSHDVMDELRAVDVAVTSVQSITKVKSSDEGDVLMDLIATDNLIDGKKKKKKEDALVDPYEHASSNAI
eukprot:1027102-Ditylum_brightwellii.AAC.1